MESPIFYPESDLTAWMVNIDDFLAELSEIEELEAELAISEDSQE